MPSLTPCCGASVGAIVRNVAGEVLMVTRGWYPAGIAPVAGHDDHDGGSAASLVAEVREEADLTVTGHRLLVEDLWLPGLCASPPAPLPGHWWRVEEVTTTGALAPDPVETRGAAFYSLDETDVLATRTIALARDEITDTEFEREPGLEAIWIELLHTAGIRTATTAERRLARRLYTTPPAHYWDDIHEREVPVEEYVAAAPRRASVHRPRRVTR